MLQSALPLICDCVFAELDTISIDYNHDRLSVCSQNKSYGNHKHCK